MRSRDRSTDSCNFHAQDAAELFSERRERAQRTGPYHSARRHLSHDCSWLLDNLKITEITTECVVYSRPLPTADTAPLGGGSLPSFVTTSLRLNPDRQIARFSFAIVLAELITQSA